MLETIRTHPEGLFLAILYYLGVRRGEALGLRWGDFDFAADQVHIQRDIDLPVPPPLRATSRPTRQTDLSPCRQS